MSATGPILALDADGVLIDATRDGKGPWSDELRTRFGVDPSELRPFFRESWPAVVTGRTPIEEPLGAALTDIGWTMGVEELLDCWFEADFCVDPQVSAVVADWVAAGVTVFLVTNQEHRRAAYLEENLQSRVALSGVLHSALVGAAKPEPAFFSGVDALLAERSAGAGPVVLLDDLEANVEAARGHGWQAVHFRPDAPWRADVERLLGL